MKEVQEESYQINICYLNVIFRHGFYRFVNEELNLYL